jgi:HEAT repeat protein
VLLHFIVSTEGPEAESAVASLLTDKSAYLRGQTISYLRSFGARKVQQASLPYLVALLKDTEVWLSGKATRTYLIKPDPTEIEFEFTVRDEAVEALQSITGMKLAEKENKNEQAKAWAQWWQGRPKR